MVAYIVCGIFYSVKKNRLRVLISEIFFKMKSTQKGLRTLNNEFKLIICVFIPYDVVLRLIYLQWN